MGKKRRVVSANATVELEITIVLPAVRIVSITNFSREELGFLLISSRNLCTARSE